MATSNKLALKVLAQDLAEDAAAYIGVFCDRASTLKLWLLGVKAASILTLAVGVYYVFQVAPLLPGAQPPLWLSGATWGLLILVAVALLGRWQAKVLTYDEAIRQYTEIYNRFQHLSRGGYELTWGQQAVFNSTLERFHRVRGTLDCRPVSSDELERSRANFRQ